MIRLRFKGNKKHPEDIAFIGLSHNNLDALKRGKPIQIKPGRKDVLGLGVELVIYAGRNEVEMAQELEKHGFVPKGSAEKTQAALSAKREFHLRSAGDEEGEAEYGEMLGGEGSV